MEKNNSTKSLYSDEERQNLKENIFNPKKKSRWSWDVDDNDLQEQIKNYKTLKITESYRGISVLIISALLGFSLLLSFFGIYTDPATMIWGIIIYLPILYFVFKGHRWAIILLITLWTFEKGYGLYESVQSGAGVGISHIIWWIIIMPYFWKALIVENRRRKISPVSKNFSGSIFCYKCGEQIEADSKFCSKCGVKTL